jgi:predicted nucleotidyltransferase component of viral defense system
MNQTLDLAVVREALQTRLLVELMSNAMHKELVLKGGMAMRAVHGSVRYTKDIDLDADLKHSRERVHGIVRRSIDRAVASGLISNATVSEPKQTETTLRWKIVGAQPGSDAPLNLTVEVSRRATLTQGHVVEVPLSDAFGGGVGAKVQVLDSQAIAVTKVLALTDPKRMAPRDLYDLHVLIQANVQEPAELLAALPNAGERLPQAIAELWPKIESMSYAQFRNDVTPFLPSAVAAVIDEAAFDDMRLEVGTNVERWLQAATKTETAPPSLHGGLLFADGAHEQAVSAEGSKPASNPKTESKLEP